ncbi:sensor histidine kinase [Streptomyces olivaceus]|uniref:sensor histidine kinase n=1 Tax=Streptomyces TaxID=1883 RepID=UPI001CCE4DA1|nr:MULTISPECIES: sensor histidine kinase [Streptomyces]MBZ6194214.1 sensor histidine kinase [Streptomyces olivaceus]MBZ6200893.1 sensor histidine kinase [Streptomyces olivaceus]MBZ6308028.1 sensor histidine kinase [Streptomyces olivaceus]MBZ6321754.1 sensor histidine kinase [Streptomyces olivaceus]MCC2267909.1 sensor histidine kinase [Streptomyces sp. CT1-17]
MSRVGPVKPRGEQKWVRDRGRRVLRVLRDDLWTWRADPLPPSVWLRRLPHGIVCLAALGVLVGDAAQLRENGGVEPGFAFVIALAEAGAMVLALWRPVAAWWLSMAGMLVGAVAVRAHMVAGPAVPAHTDPVPAHADPVPTEVVQAGPEFTWPWTAAGLIAHLFVLLLLALRVRTRVSGEALALTAFVTYLLQGVVGAPAYLPTDQLALILFTVVVVLGMALRGRREARSQLARQTSLTAEERARRTLLEERSRIARELHDVVAHHMSVISIQAQVAPHLVADPPDELKENLDGIRQNALEALTELRRVLGVLRSEHPDAPAAPEGGDAAPHAPQPTLDRLDALVENTRAAGLTVTTGTSGTRRPLPPGVELSAYRIVQEALSNVLRHAPGADARVHLTHLPTGLRVEVSNTRPTRAPGPSQGAGHGLLGMRERVAMLDGSLTADPLPDGGYQVAAFLPADAAGPPHHPGHASAPDPTPTLTPDSGPNPTEDDTR